ncbi:multiple epidermal growth factor-like domains protein 11 [Liolophura sinensis]|uniref:multiple epidermal growth factor-like domains protein 11 n=1 Tax=Liolophura sinensis TaxID=3198878 RepID=UPI003158FA44
MITNFFPLTLCEVQIFVCIPGTYGPDCEKRCGKCVEGPSVCNTTSGHCPQRTPRCMAGYSGPRCDKNCNPGTYGSDCEMKCGHCFEWGSVCDVTVGHCPDRIPRCMSGYSGVTCDTECKNNTWGKDCLQTCGKCYNKTECDAVTGECPVTTGNSTCDPGYSERDCIKECTPGTYGPGCEMRCGNCAEGPTLCNTISGLCPLRTPRCMPGYSPPKCESDSSVSSLDYSRVIAGSAAGICLVLIIGVIIIVIMIRRNPRNVQTGGAVVSEPNSTPAQKSSIPAESTNTNGIHEPSSLYNTCDANSCEDHSYMAIHEYVNL